MKFLKFLFPLITTVFLAGCMTISTSGNYTLPKGRTLRGNLIITSGKATLEEGSRVTGSVIMTSGTLNANGKIDGDIQFTSSRQVSLGPNAVVNGDIRGTSGEIQLADGAKVGGQISTDNTFTLGGGFFTSVFGTVCGIPLALIITAVYLVFSRRKTPAKTRRSVNPVPLDIPGKLKQLKQMQVEGLISTEDYEAKKVDILAKL